MGQEIDNCLESYLSAFCDMLSQAICANYFQVEKESPDPDIAYPEIYKEIYPDIVRAAERHAGREIKYALDYEALLLLTDFYIRKVYPCILSELFRYPSNDPEENAMFDEVVFAGRELASGPAIDDAEILEFVTDFISGFPVPMPLVRIVINSVKGVETKDDVLSAARHVGSFTATALNQIYAKQRIVPARQGDIAGDLLEDLRYLLDGIATQTYPDSSPALRKFINESGFIYDAAGTYSPEFEDRISKRLEFCVKELEQLTGLTLRAVSPGKAAATAIKKAPANMFDAISTLIIETLDDCVLISNPEEDE
jgi:hypothetical protein